MFSPDVAEDTPGDNINNTVKCGDANVTITVDDQSDENISFPSSSSSSETTPVPITAVEISKHRGSPIMRGLQNVLNMFRSSQGPVEQAHEVSTPDVVASRVSDGSGSLDSPVVASTPVANRKQDSSKRNSPLKDSIVFTEELSSDLQWNNDDSTVLFQNERVPLHKLFMKQSLLSSSSDYSNESNKNNLNLSVEPMDISFNDSLVANKTVVGTSKLAAGGNESLEPMDISYNDTMNKTEVVNNDESFSETILLSETNNNSLFLDCESSYDIQNETELLQSFNEAIDVFVPAVEDINLNIISNLKDNNLELSNVNVTQIVTETTKQSLNLTEEMDVSPEKTLCEDKTLENSKVDNSVLYVSKCNDASNQGDTNKTLEGNKTFSCVNEEVTKSFDNAQAKFDPNVTVTLVNELEEVHKSLEGNDDILNPDLDFTLNVTKDIHHNHTFEADGTFNIHTNNSLGNNPDMVPVTEEIIKTLEDIPNTETILVTDSNTNELSNQFIPDKSINFDKTLSEKKLQEVCKLDDTNIIREVSFVSEAEIIDNDLKINVNHHISTQMIATLEENRNETTVETEQIRVPVINKENDLSPLKPNEACNEDISDIAIKSSACSDKDNIKILNTQNDENIMTKANFNKSINVTTKVDHCLTTTTVDTLDKSGEPIEKLPEFVINNYNHFLNDITDINVTTACVSNCDLINQNVKEFKKELETELRGEINKLLNEAVTFCHQQENVEKETVHIENTPHDKINISEERHTISKTVLESEVIDNINDSKLNKSRGITDMDSTIINSKTEDVVNTTFVTNILNNTQNTEEFNNTNLEENMNTLKAESKDATIVICHNNINKNILQNETKQNEQLQDTLGNVHLLEISNIVNNKSNEIKHNFETLKDAPIELSPERIKSTDDAIQTSNCTVTGINCEKDTAFLKDKPMELTPEIIKSTDDAIQTSNCTVTGINFEKDSATLKDKPIELSPEIIKSTEDAIQTSNCTVTGRNFERDSATLKDKPMELSSEISKSSDDSILASNSTFIAKSNANLNISSEQNDLKDHVELLNSIDKGKKVIKKNTTPVSKLNKKKNEHQIPEAIPKPEVPQIMDEIDFDNLTDPFATKTKIRMSPPSTPSKHVDDLNLDEIQNPFATKSKIRLSTPPISEMFDKNFNANEIKVMNTEYIEDFIESDKENNPLNISNISQKDKQDLIKRTSLSNRQLISNSFIKENKNDIAVGEHNKIETYEKSKDVSSEQSVYVSVSENEDLPALKVIKPEVNLFEEGLPTKLDIISDNNDDLEFELNDDMMQMDVDPNEPEEMFIDAAGFDFLMNKNANCVSDNGKDSLFLKFDPLYARRMTLDQVAAAHKSDTFISVNEVTENEDINTTVQENAPQEGLEDLNVTIAQKPTMPVLPVVNNTANVFQVVPSTPSMTNRHSMTFCSPAVSLIDRLLSINTPDRHDMTVTHDVTVTHRIDAGNEVNDALGQLLQLLSEKEQDKNKLISERRELETRLDNLESQLTSLEKENEDKQKKLKEVTETLDAKNNQYKNMVFVVKEFERTIATLVADVENDKRANAEERTKLLTMIDEQNTHLSNMEMLFKDLHSKFEKSKQAVLTYKANEEELKKKNAEYEESFSKMQRTYEQLKQHATAKLNEANEQLDAIKRSNETEIIKMKAHIKRKELHISSLEQSINQKTKDNEELTAICDELLNRGC